MYGFLFNQMLIFISNTITETVMIHRQFNLSANCVWSYNKEL